MLSFYSFSSPTAFFLFFFANVFANLPANQKPTSKLTNQKKERLPPFSLLSAFFFLSFCFSSFFYWPTPLTSCSSPFIAMVLAYKFGHAWARIGAVWVSSMGVMWSSEEVVAWEKEERQVVHACWRVCCHMKGGSRAWSW